MERKSFVFYKEWKEAISDLPDDIRLEIYESIIEYATTGNLPVLKPMAKIAFNFIKTMIDRDAEKYMSITERNKSNGKKGGRPVKEPKKTSGFFGNPEEPKKPDNDYDYDNEHKKESPNGDEKEGEPSSPALNPDFIKFNDWLKRKAPFCNNIKNFPTQITEEEFLKLKSKYSGKEIADTIEQIENRKDLRKRYVNLYRTVLNWAKKEYGK